MAQGSERRVQQEMQRIRGALLRMDEGTYGECLNCEEPIGAGRLRADLRFCSAWSAPAARPAKPMVSYM
ncbi:TraR/DksA family transcriptional regulator [Thiohalorhabdus sp.]|uniref:TraR/DksA family transcriptional regulator n=1 Tax=Thiohalorhabdus sp. TaxID=3094134 RepID=UPI002FC32DB4